MRISLLHGIREDERAAPSRQMDVIFTQVATEDKQDEARTRPPGLASIGSTDDVARLG